MPFITPIPADLCSAVSSSWWVGNRHVMSSNPWTRHMRASGPTDERWQVDVTLPLKRREDLDRWETVFDQGDGLAGFYSAFDAVHRIPFGTATGLTRAGGTGLAWCEVGAAGVRGARYVTLTGLIASQSLGLAQGDLISIAQDGEDYGFLHKIIANAATDGTGGVTVMIKPRLRENVVVGQMVKLENPRGVFRLIDEDVPVVSREAGGFGQPSVRLVEIPEALLVNL